MKKSLFFIMCSLGLALFFGSPATAQKALPASVGNWVVETNVLQKDYSLVSFYSASNQLLYQEKLQGVYLDISRRKTQRMLNTTLLNLVQSKPIANKYFKGTATGKVALKS